MAGMSGPVIDGKFAVASGGSSDFKNLLLTISTFPANPASPRRFGDKNAGLTINF
ncbi:hypothetical protein ABNQ39_19860 [Azospirillum sp. A26]|uniref:hypothetical protein n=1 Tax=Azospirillum sp. A26 TaxID=3160607 RepID=UPI00366B7DAE